MSVTGLEGVRVLRGPDWKGGDDDGGEGYLGTVTQLLGNHEVRVLWDMGQERTYSAGKDGVVELRVFDTATVGIRQPGSRCAECGETDIYGMLWRCQDCADCDLCPLCYSDDKHNLRHRFLRIDIPSSEGSSVSKRKSSVKIRAIGLHPGAKVTRGKDWKWGDQDGGEGSEGEVEGYDNKAAVVGMGARNMLMVQWPHGGSHSYRLGVHGKVDLTCVEEEVGPFYYRDHLPLLDTTQSWTTLVLQSVSTTPAAGEEPVPRTTGTLGLSPTSCLAPSERASGSLTDVSSVKGQATAEVEDEEVKVGDRVAICVEEEKLRELQQNCGGVTARMLRCIGRTGEVTNIFTNGVVAVKFAGSAKVSYRFNRQALVKVTGTFTKDDVVRIRDDIKQLRVLNTKLGWPPAMDRTVNKVGRVVEVIWDQEGDLRVDFKGQKYVYAPACCLPAAGAALDSLSGGQGAQGGSEISNPADESQDETRQNKAMFRKVRELLKEGSQKDDGGDIRELFHVIELDADDAVRSICLRNPALMQQEHHDLTPLIYACLRGKMCSTVTLLDLGADVNQAASDNRNKTPLSAVLEGKSEAIAEVLLARGADTTYLYRQGQTVVHLAVYREKTAVLKALISHGADLNVKTELGDTPLHMAIEQRKHRAMEVLMDAPQADIYVGNSHDFNMIHLACYHNNTKALEKLLARDCSGVERRRKGRSTALHIAATNNHVDCVRLLVINGGADVNARQADSEMTSLHITSHSAKLQTVEALLELGASANVQDKDGDTPLHLALGGVIEGYGKTERAEAEVGYRVQIANMLITSGAFVDAENKQGKHPFVYGASSVRDRVRTFMESNRQVVRLKSSSRKHTLLRNLGVSEVKGEGQGQLKEALKGVGLPCGVCGALKSDVTLSPCQHKCVCSACSVEITRCPLCDEEVRDMVKTGQDEKSLDPEACKQM